LPEATDEELAAPSAKDSLERETKMRTRNVWKMVMGMGSLVVAAVDGTAGLGADSLVVLENPPLVVTGPSGTATGCLYLLNDSDGPLSVRLSAHAKINSGLSSARVCNSNRVKSGV
jgi:hypothetical protein